MGRLFTSYDEAWSFFLGREEPLEDFFVEFPEAPAWLDVWLLLPSERLADEVAELQLELTGLDGLRPVPRHFLHVSVAHDGGTGPPPLIGAVEAMVGPVTCFHEAVVLEVHAERLPELARHLDPGREPATFLPHLSVAYVEGRPDPAAIRDALEPLRSRRPIGERFREVTRCLVPASRTTILDPWRVVETAPLD